MTAPDPNTAFLLKGYAGTGKTSLVSALVRALTAMKYSTVLLAPTGRSAKVFGHHAQKEAFTIHKRIYRQQTFSLENGRFTLDRNRSSHTLFIVDEVSMISDSTAGNLSFGSGQLLTDLLRYVYEGEDCRLMLVGDTAQLPPVGSEESPALQQANLEKYGLHTYWYEMKGVVRQSAGSAILRAATGLRLKLDEGSCSALPRLQLSAGGDLQPVSGMDIVERIASSYDEVGVENTIVICRSNKLAHRYSQGIRYQVLFREESLSRGDLLMVTKNNYAYAGETWLPGFIANGDVVRLERIKSEETLFGLHFADAVVSFPDYDDAELDVKLMLDALHDESGQITTETSRNFFIELLASYSNAKDKAEMMKKVKADPYYNALQVRFAYALTCQKAQGGQWAHVYIDQGYVTEDMMSAGYYRWLYTALTRATTRAWLVNWPAQQWLHD